MRQFLMNARAIECDRVRTEVSWTDGGLLGFFEKQGFVPGGQLVLERSVGRD